MSLCADCGAEMGPGFAESHRYHHEKWLDGVPPAVPAESKAVDMPHPLYIPLWRMAVALEEQNRFNWEWIALNKTWRAENEASDISAHVLACHEQNATRDQEYRAQILHMAEKQARETNEIIQASYEAYLESLKKQGKQDE